MQPLAARVPVQLQQASLSLLPTPMSNHEVQDVPPWPSLYNPGLEILNIQHNDPVRPGAHYLYRATDVFRFTLYWTLIFYLPLFVLCGCYAFWNYAFPPSRRNLYREKMSPQPSYQLRLSERSEGDHLSNLTSPVFSGSTPISSTKPIKLNERRSRVTFALIVLFTFITLSLAGAVIGSTILGFVTAGLYHVAKFHMSTWIPFLLSVMQVMTGLLSIWPAIIEII